MPSPKLPSHFTLFVLIIYLNHHENYHRTEQIEGDAVNREAILAVLPDITAYVDWIRVEDPHGADI